MANNNNDNMDNYPGNLVLDLGNKNLVAINFVLKNWNRKPDFPVIKQLVVPHLGVYFFEGSSSKRAREGYVLKFGGRTTHVHGMEKLT